MNEWVAAFLFFLPAGIANATPVLANKVPLLNRWGAPVDFGINWRGKRLLGANKRWRGIVTGTVLAGLTALLLAPIDGHQESLATTAFLGCVMGFGALLGDAIESGFKRRRNIPAGSSWFPFDQIDYIIGGLLLVWPFAHLSLRTMVIIFVTFFGLHLIVAYLAYLLKLKDKPI